MVEVHTHPIKPTPLMPNSPHLLIHYPGLLRAKMEHPNFARADLYDLFASNGWELQWQARYGPTQSAHYHSTAHEAMAVVSGRGATIRFGVADTTDDEEENTHGNGYEPGGVEIHASKGDVFIVPAGVAHKTYDPKPDSPGITFHQCKDENGVVIRDQVKARKFFEDIEDDEHFQMIGGYPSKSDWDFAVGGQHRGREKQIWSVPKPEKDPVLGDSPEGLVGLWEENPLLSKS